MANDLLLKELTEETGSAQEARWILEAVTARVSHDQEVAAMARGLAARRAAGEPLQYVLGSWQFRDLELRVDERALIPRPETEQIVEAVLQRWRTSAVNRSALTIVDLGTGTGAIGLSLASALQENTVLERVILSDQSRDALELALENTMKLGIERVEFRLGSWFDALEPALKGKIDLLVSNPPYVAVSERPGLATELFYEPDEALFSLDAKDGTPGFRDVATILSEVGPWLSPGGVVGIEMGEGQVEPAVALASAVGLEDVEVIYDLAEKPRGLSAVKNP